jgi:hypothetical protein
MIHVICPVTQDLVLVHDEEAAEINALRRHCRLNRVKVKPGVQVSDRIVEAQNWNSNPEASGQ